MLANKGHYLALAEAMEQGGILFGIDEQGNPLISDRGDQPIMTGMDYNDTRFEVMYEYYIDGRNGQKIVKKEVKNEFYLKPIETGYEMFPYAEPHGKSSEISQYESHTGRYFVQPYNKWLFTSSWLESGENPPCPRALDLAPYDLNSRVTYHHAYPKREQAADFRGVRRLLRLKKAA